MSDHSDKHKPFSASLFLITILLSVSVYLSTLALVAPSVWKVQLSAGWVSFTLTFLACHLFNAMFEFFFHRYVLHCPLIPGLYRFYKSHTKHHRLTSVIWRRVGVNNRYPILEEKQHEDSFFPWYSYTVFILVLTPLFILVHIFFPTVPIFLAGALALVWSISLYEILHSKWHLPPEKWDKKLYQQNRYKRVFWRIVYGFHLRHHVNYRCNEGISGFFGIPVADFLFDTWINSKSLYTHGEHVNREEFDPPPRPIFFIRWLDDIAQKQVQKQRDKKRG